VSHAALSCSFNITDRFVHDISVTGTEHGTVIMNGAGLDINLDHHRMAPYQVGGDDSCCCCCMTPLLDVLSSVSTASGEEMACDVAQ
jgi:hypothetical protein